MTLALSDPMEKSIHDPFRGSISAIAANDSRQFIGTAENVHFHGDETQFVDDSHLPCARNARFNSLVDSEESLYCLESTCVQILRDIDNWVDDRKGRCIFWLSGLAGTGKTTIARTVARKCDKKGRLGASFFFSEIHSDTRCATGFVTTIARQLADTDASLRGEINQAIRQRRQISSYALEDQWRHLILEPLVRVKREQHQLPYILVIDGLEQCDKTAGIATVLRLLAQIQTVGSGVLRVLLTSMPDTRIEAGFCDIPDDTWSCFKLHSIDKEVMNHDIRSFLSYRFKHIAKKHQQAEDWPGLRTIDLLTQRAGGLFIWAATACTFVGSDSRFSQQRLIQLLDNQVSIDDPISELDRIYLTVLRSTVSEKHTAEEKESIYEIVRLALGNMAVLVCPLPTTDLAALLQFLPQSCQAGPPKTKCINAREISIHLKHLGAIVDVPEEADQPLRLHHPALHEYLFDSARCTEHAFHVNKRQIHLTLAGCCVDLMSQAWDSVPSRREIFDLRKPGDAIADGNLTRSNQRLPASVRYACLYWVHHLKQSGDTHHKKDSFDRFLRRHGTHWIEVLNSKAKLSHAHHAIASLEDMTFSDSVGSYVRATKRFLLSLENGR